MFYHIWNMGFDDSEMFLNHIGEFFFAVDNILKFDAADAICCLIRSLIKRINFALKKNHSL